jgi:WD40 repeat protein
MALEDEVVIEVKSETFRPIDIIGSDGKPLSSDPRSLGVQVQDIKLLASLPPQRPQVPIVGDGSKRAPLSTPMIFTPLLTCAALAPDGKLVVAGAPEGTIVTLDLAGNRHSVLPQLAPQLLAIAVNPASGMFATATDDRLVKLWETASGKPRATWSGHTRQITALAFSPDGKTLASVGGDRFRAGELKLWDLQTGKEQVAIAPFKLRLWCVAIAPDGKRAAVGSGDGTAYLVDMKSGKVQTSIAVSAYIRRIAFSPDGKWLAAGYGDKGQVRILGVNDGKLRSDLQVPGGTYVEGLEFTRDSKSLFTACGEGNAVIWDLSKAPAPVAALTAAKTGALPFALLLPDGRSFASGGKDGLIQLVRFPDEKNFATRALIEFLRVVHP